jgi:cytoskeletal protein CcmA (bactofilin family)
MWNSNKQPQNDYPAPAPAQPSSYPAAPAASTFNSAPAPAAPVRSNVPAAKNLATLGPGLTVKGQISGDEDLQVEGKVEGPISLKGQRLTIGSAGEIVSDVHAREVIVYGKVRGNLFAEDRVEVKKDGSVIGNITGGRVLIEDGAYLKGQIEIQRNSGSKSHHHEKELETVGSASN